MAFHQLRMVGADIRGLHYLNNRCLRAKEVENRAAKCLKLCPEGTNTPQIGKVGMPENADFDLLMRTAGVRGMSDPEDIAATIAFNDEKLGLVYPARVIMDRSKIKVAGRWVNLSPGMAVTVEVKTGKRRIIEFFLSPLLRYKQESIRER